MEFPGKPSRRTVLAVFLAASVVMFVLGPVASGWVRAKTDWLFAPFGDALMGPATSFKAHLAGMDAGEFSPAEVRRIVKWNESLRSQLYDLEEQMIELRRREAFARVFSEELFGGSRELPCTLVPARVVGADSLPYGSNRLLNVGRSRGAAPGRRVTTRLLLTDRSKAIPTGYRTITANALVGRITETSAFTARLQLLTDPGFGVRANVRRAYDPQNPRQVRIERKGSPPQLLMLTDKLAREELIAVDLRGDGSQGLVAEDVKASHDIRPGDWVQTRRDDALLPAVVRIGQVVEVTPRPDNSLFVTLRIRPHADLDSLREVYIVCPKGVIGNQ